MRRTLVVAGQEAEERSQQRRGVERVGVVVLAQDAVAHAVLEDVGLDLVGDRLPSSCCSSGSPRISASLAARSSATQHISFDDT